MRYGRDMDRNTLRPSALKNVPVEKSTSTHWWLSRNLWLAIIYLLAAAIPALRVVHYSENQVASFQKMCDIDNFQNNIMADHTFLGPIVKFFIHQRKVHLPSVKEAKASLAEMSWLRHEGLDEKASAGVWSQFLLILSFVYLLLTLVYFDNDRWKHLLFSLTSISVVFFAVGISAPAMVIAVISPENAVVNHFVLDHSSRSILGVLSELFSYGHWIIAGSLTIFSVVIPIIKASLTLFAVETSSLASQLKISKFLDLIGKWSMTDVFVAAIILANFAIRADPSTPRTDLIIGFYYFLGYCILSMLVTTVLHLQLQRLKGNEH